MKLITNLIDLIYLFKLWHSEKPFFYARVQKVTTYNTSTSDKLNTYNTQRDIIYNITHTHTMTTVQPQHTLTTLQLQHTMITIQLQHTSKRL